jgi:hypothetical protein
VVVGNMALQGSAMVESNAYAAAHHDGVHIPMHRAGLSSWMKAEAPITIRPKTLERV